MRVFTIHIGRLGVDPLRDIAVVKEGFCWPAFFFSALWALWHRLWGTALVLVGLELAVGAASAHFQWSRALDAVASLAIAVALGHLANDLRRRALLRRGFEDMGVIAAEDRDAALRRFLDARPTLVFGMGA